MSPAGSGGARFDGGLDARIARAARRLRLWWPTAGWLAGFGLIVMSGQLPPVVGYTAIVGACVLLGGALGAHGGDPNGLRKHRQ